MSQRVSWAREVCDRQMKEIESIEEIPLLLNLAGVTAYLKLPLKSSLSATVDPIRPRQIANLGEA